MRVLAGLLSTACLFAAAPARAADRVVVRFSGSADASDRAAAREQVDAVAPRSEPGLTGVQVVTVPEGDAAAAARTLAKSSDVLWAHPDHRVHAAVALPADAGSAADQQWGLLNSGQSIAGSVGNATIDGDFTPAWNTTEGAGVTIAVVDTGVDFTIADLAPNRASYAWDFVDGDADASPAPPPASDPTSEETSHGTNVAGIAAAALGVHEASGDIAGGAPAAKIMALRALDETGSGWDSDIASAFAQAAAHGARVVNASLGAPGAAPELAQAIHDHPSTLFVVAAGNSGVNEDTAGANADYPCVVPEPNVVCVAAIDNTGALAGFSNYGATMVDIAAPGVKILSYVRGGGAEYWSGTSMATPYVSAAAALAFAANPRATAAQVRQAIIATARPLAALHGDVVANGMLDANALVRAAVGLPPAPTPVVPKPTPAPKTTPPAPAPVVTPAPALHSPKLALHKPRRRGRTLSLSGSTSRLFHGTVTIKATHARTVRVRVRNGAFAVKLRPTRHGRITITVRVPAGSGFKAAAARRTIRF
jgi:thermitase